VAGLKKSKPEHAEEIAALIKETIKKEIENGFDSEAIEGILRRMEFKAREIGGDSSYPLSFARKIYKFWIYGCDPVKFLQFEEQFARIRENIKEKPRYLETLLEDLTLKNKNEILMITQASSEMGENLGNLSLEQAKKLSENFTADDKIKYAKFTKELTDYQKREHTPQELSCIPMLKKSDIPKKGDIVATNEGDIYGVKWLNSRLFTGGVFYLNLAFDLSVIPDELLEYVPLYMEYIGRCGAGGLSAGEMSKLWKLHSGGFSSFSLISGNYYTRNSFVANNVFSVKSLEKNTAQTLDCLSKALFEPDFGDKNLIKNVLNEEKNDIFEDIIQHGHSHAIIDAAARFSTANVIKYRLEGIGFFCFLRNLREKEDDILAKLRKIHSIFINSQNLTISTACNESNSKKRLHEFIAKIPAFEPEIELTVENLRNSPLDEIHAIRIPSSVNYAADVFQIDENDPKFVGEVMLLSQILSKGYLWDKVRVEGGAYGGFCGFNAVSKIFSFASFRDPNISKTFESFAKALKENPVSQEMIDRSIPSEIGNLDAPKSPSTKVTDELQRRLSMYSDEKKQEIREAILSADEKSIAKDIKILLERAETSQKTVLGSKEAILAAQKEGLVFKKVRLC
jgi:Zn-dependent M16 (insulinase) family peptidase